MLEEFKSEKVKLDLYSAITECIYLGLKQISCSIDNANIKNTCHIDSDNKDINVSCDIPQPLEVTGDINTNIDIPQPLQVIGTIITNCNIPQPLEITGELDTNVNGNINSTVNGTITANIPNPITVTGTINTISTNSCAEAMAKILGQSSSFNEIIMLNGEQFQNAEDVNVNGSIVSFTSQNQKVQTTLCNIEFVVL